MTQGESTSIEQRLNQLADWNEWAKEKMEQEKIPFTGNRGYDIGLWMTGLANRAEEAESKLSEVEQERKAERDLLTEALECSPNQTMNFLIATAAAKVGTIARLEGERDDWKDKYETAHDAKSVGTIGWLANQYLIRATAATQQAALATEKLATLESAMRKQISLDRPWTCDVQEWLKIITSEKGESE